MGLTVTGTSTNNGTFTIKSDATGTGSFILETTGFTANFQQYIDNNNEYHFISVPFKATMPEICDGNWAPITTAFDQSVGATYDFYYLDETASSNYWINLKNDSWGVNTSDFGDPPRFVKGKGYLVAYSSSFSGSDTKSSTGTLQNDNLTYALTASSLTYNLIGNPFPSSLDWKGSGWGRTKLEDDSGYNLWIWNGSSGQFGTYNSGSGSDDGTHGTSRYIAPAQGFYVQAVSGGGNLIFPAASRTHSTKTLLKKTNSNKQLRLFVSGDENPYSDEIIIEFGHSDNTGGSPKLASLYSTAPSLSTIKEGTNFSIDFRTNEINQNIIPVAFEPGVNGTYVISGSDFNFETVLLKDKKSSEIIDLKLEGSYSFGSVVGDDSDRFELLFSPVGIDEQVTVSDIKIFANNGNITILNNNTLTGSINIVNVLGQTVFSSSLNGNTKQNIRLDQEIGVYIINIKTESGSFISQKVIIN